ncbi:MAG: hypothetical protein K2K34_04335, partial [Oscillospiraceae bacterium]|nr:hypothetical protein [Oscillospiraceae bacterium]
LKKKRFFTSKQLEKIRLEFCNFFDMHEEYFARNFTAKFREIKDGKLRFICSVSAHAENVSYSVFNQKLTEAGMPSYLKAEITCSTDGKDIEFPVSSIKKETRHSDLTKSSWIAWSASSEDLK